MMNILRPNDPECADIALQRADIAARKAQIRETRDAPWPRSHRDALLNAELQRIVNHATDARHRYAKVIDPTNDAATFPALDWPLLLDLFGVDQVQQLITERIDRLGLPEGLAPAERAQRLRVLERELFDMEVAEELAICALEAKTGAHVLRRTDVNAAAVVAAWQKAAA